MKNLKAIWDYTVGRELKMPQWLFLAMATALAWLSYVCGAFMGYGFGKARGRIEANKENSDKVEKEGKYVSISKKR